MRRRPLRAGLRLALLAPVLICGIGCATKPFPVTQPEAVDGPAATVKVVRAWRRTGAGLRVYVTLDGRVIAGLSNGGHTSVDVTPGPHEVGVLWRTLDIAPRVRPGPFAKTLLGRFSPGDSQTFLIWVGSHAEEKKVELLRVDRLPPRVRANLRHFVEPGTDAN